MCIDLKSFCPLSVHAYMHMYVVLYVPALLSSEQNEFNSTTCTCMLLHISCIPVIPLVIKCSTVACRIRTYSSVLAKALALPFASPTLLVSVCSCRCVSKYRVRNKEFEMQGQLTRHGMI